jgi:protein-disulfide isomerase
VHDRLFSASPNLEDSDLEGVARAAGLDVKKAMAAVTKDAHKQAISADADVADDFSANGTPHFFINGRRLVGAQPYEKFKALIDEELPKAEALARSGVALTAIYETTIKDGNGPAELEQKSVRANPSAPFRGPANAPVVIQEFSDFQCPFCGRAEPTLDQILKTYPTKVKIVWRDMPLPFHVDAPLAAEAAREAYAQKGNAGFQKMRELLFKNQHQLKRQDLEGYAAKVGLDLTKFRKALDDHRHKAAVDADADAARDAGINGTPGFLVGPYFISGAQPFAKFRRAIERALAGPPAPVAARAAAAVAPSAAGATGLGIVDLAPGSGAAVKNGDTVTVHYTGTLTNGTVFDSSRKSGRPFTFQVGAGHVIKGWEKGLVGMKVGGKRKLTIPADLGYGDRGAPPVIPPRSTLVFEIELLSIK